MKADLVIRNGIVHTPSGPIVGGVAVTNGRITWVGSDESLPSTENMIDAGSLHVMPGLIDAHGIFGRGDWSGTARQESVHAAVNGVTTIIGYVQMGDPTVRGRVTVHRGARELCERESFVDFKFNAALGTLEQIDEIPELFAEGVHGFSFFINLSKLERDQYGFPHLDYAYLYRAMEKIREVGPPAFASVHCEEPEIIHMLFERAAATGKQDLRTWADTRPSFTEGVQTFAVGLIGLELGVPISFVHVAAPEALDAVRYVRGRGGRVFAETCPQYLTVSPTDEVGLVGKQMPPLRDDRYQQVLWRAVTDGTIDFIGSDHQIAKREDKEAPGLWGLPNERAGSGGGLTGSIAPIMLSEGVNQNRITLNQFVKLCSENPARIYGIYPTKGAIVPGSDADLIVVDLDRRWVMSVESLKSSSDFCLWDGWQVRGKVVKTFVRGRLVAEDGDLVSDKPAGHHVGPTHPASSVPV
jgi:dihydropyrimidinase